MFLRRLIGSCAVHRAQLRASRWTKKMVPQNPDALLTRSQTAAALTECGYPVKASTLATWASRGGGPVYRIFGVRPLYRWGDALDWAQQRLSAPRRNTSEADAA